MSTFTQPTSSLTASPNSGADPMFCSNAPLVSKQNKLRLLLVQTPPSVLYITAKDSPLIFHFLVSSQRIQVVAKIMLVLTVRRVGSSLPIIILACNMVKRVAAKRRLLSGSAIGYTSTVLIYAISMYLWIKVANFILTLTLSMYFQNIDTRSILQALIPPIRMVLLNALTVSSVIMFVPS